MCNSCINFVYFRGTTNGISGLCCLKNKKVNMRDESCSCYKEK